MAIDTFALPKAKRVRTNPSAEELQALAAADAERAAHRATATSTCRPRVLARSKASTFLVSDEPDRAPRR